ncbi:MAG: hypothetical protein K0R57_3412 [Paenibacillaceae bacterium]|jgi:hypothetical protein|nr:hypothetical protein [Paenibacillaceae bacterium]
MTQFNNVSGIFPHLSVSADVLPFRTECGIGGLMSWADRLWMITYVAHYGEGSGLYEIDHNLNMRKHPESVVGTYANRLIHSASNSIIIGPHIIDHKGNVRTIDGVKDYRLAATMEHLTDPQNKVYFLSMEGPMLEVDLNTFKTEVLFDLTEELAVAEKYQNAMAKASTMETDKIGNNVIANRPQPHFKAGHTAAGRVVVANNTFSELDHTGEHQGGRLAEWDGKQWTIVQRTAFNEVTGRKNWGEVIFATGWDRASAIMMAFINGEWQKYRLPKASHNFEHFWQTEWPRIREIETERYMMDASGMFYELTPVPFRNKIWGIKPVCSHIRVIADYTCWKGMMVMGSNQTSPVGDTNLVTGYPESNLWFGKPDDLWQWGKPAGWGGPWWEEEVKANLPSDPYLMTGFDKKVLHLTQKSEDEVTFKLEVDFLGDGSWVIYDRVKVQADGYVHHEFPTGFSAHWIRVTPDLDCQATAYFIYT